MKALMLGGGKGTRLRPLTFTLAKQLILVANKPSSLNSRDSINKIGLIIAPETGHYVEDYVQDGAELNLNITYIQQEPRPHKGGLFLNATYVC